MTSTDSANMITSKRIRIGCIGGGQLGRMMALEAPRLNIEMSFLDPAGINCPAAMVVPSNNILEGSLKDATKIKELAFRGGRTDPVDVMTVEIEHINVDALAELEQLGVNVQPRSRILRIIQDKFLQKKHFQQHDIDLPEFAICNSIACIQQAIDTLGLPLMLKSRKGAYDGRGNAVIENADSILQAVQKLVPPTDVDLSTRSDLDLYVEGWIDFSCEIAVMVVRSAASDEKNPITACYPAVNAIQQDSICRVVLAPARNIPQPVRSRAEELAVKAIDSLGEGASGMFGVELFVTKAGDVLLNEVAPRPHNTGHYTQAACCVNQFENHLRAICGWNPGPTSMMIPSAAMINILGAKSGKEIDTLASSNAALHMSRGVDATVHWYGKEGCKAGRKMGHINLTAATAEELDMPLFALLELEGVPNSLLSQFIQKQNKQPLVGVIMGSHSDLPTMQDAVEILKQFDIPYEVDIVSAHRTPAKLMEYSQSAASRGIQVIIAGAGGAAHLPGMVASMTALPVIGVPIKTSTLSGVDSLYSIVQMPKGIPVATVAIGNAANAGLLAVRILGSHNRNLQGRMVEYQTKLRTMVEETSAKLVQIGSDEYLKQMENKNKSVNV